MKRPRYVWIDGMGEEHYVDEMEDRHLANSIAKCKRENWRLKQLPILLYEQKLREDVKNAKLTKVLNES